MHWVLLLLYPSSMKTNVSVGGPSFMDSVGRFCRPVKLPPVVVVVVVVVVVTIGYTIIIS
jgi:hypothetical protein